MPERAELSSLDNSAHVRSSRIIEFRIAAIQAMADLCGRVEHAKGTSGSQKVSKVKTVHFKNTADREKVHRSNNFPE